MSNEQQKKPQKRKADAKRGAFVFPLVVICGIALSAFVTFGNPILWVTEVQAQILMQQNNGTNQDPQPGTNGQPSTNGKTVISQYKAVSQSADAQRATNIKLATDAIHGAVIQPGKTLSFNELVGDTAHDSRYQLAPVVYGSDMVYERGGGICQVSTALYNAALKANLVITERHPHSLVVDYAPIGLDATLVYGTMDLRITNTSEQPMQIVAEAEGQTVTITIWGQALSDGMTIDVMSRVVERRDSQGRQQKADDKTTTLPDDMYYVVESYRVYYKHGTKTYSQKLGTDEYKVHKNSTVTLPEGGFDPTK